MHELAVSGNLTVMDEYALQGGGISMDDTSTLIFQEPWLLASTTTLPIEGVPFMRQSLIMGA